MLRKLFVVTVLAYFLIPMIVGNVLLAQRQGDELGRVATGLCCLDACTAPLPNLGPVGGIIATIFLVGFIILVIWVASSEKAHKQKVIEDTKSYENWVHRTVSLTNDPEFRGVVVHQEYDKLYINAVSYYGTLYQITRKISEVNHVKTKESSNGAETEAKD